MGIEVHDGVCDRMMCTEKKEVIRPGKIVNSWKAVNGGDLFDNLFDDVMTGSRNRRTKGRIKPLFNKRRMLKRRMIGVRSRRKGRIKHDGKIKGDKEDGRRIITELNCSMYLPTGTQLMIS
jgi:hypothetical protein